MENLTAQVYLDEYSAHLINAQRFRDLVKLLLSTASLGYSKTDLMFADSAIQAFLKATCGTLYAERVEELKNESKSDDSDD